jgi:hypothetical protein
MESGWAWLALVAFGLAVLIIAGRNGHGRK